MTKKESRTANPKPEKEAAHPKKGLSRSLIAMVSLTIILVLAFIGNQLDLVDSGTFQQILEDYTGADGPLDLPGAGPVVIFTPLAPQATGQSWPNQGPWYQIYFTTPQFPDEPATRSETIVQGLIGVIGQAQTSLDLAIFELDLPEIGQALLAAQERGVRVRLVTDSDELDISDTLRQLQRAKVPIVTDERTSLMHNKFMVIDSRAVWTGSWNFTANDTFRNNNHAILLHSGELAQNFSAEFAEMFEQKQFGPTSPINTPHPRIIRGETLIESCFAPEDRCADQIIRLVRQAQRTIRFMAFSFTHDGIGKAIRDRANDGIRVEGVFESRGSDVASSEYESLRRKKLDIWLDGNPYTMHHKIIIIDNQTVILGSFNFSDSANEANDENMLAIHDRAVTEAYLAEFDRVYRQAQAP